MSNPFLILVAVWPPMNLSWPGEAVVSEFWIALLRSSALIAITGFAVWLLLKSTRVQSPVVKRYLALGILLQGCIFFRWTIELPWKEPVQPVAVVGPADRAPGDIPASMAHNEDKLLPQQLLPASEGPGDIDSNKSTDLQPAAATWHWWQVLFAAWGVGLASIFGLAMLLYIRLWIHLRGEQRVSAEQLPEWGEALASMGFAACNRTSLCLTDRYGPSVVLLPRETVVLVPRDVWTELNRAERLAVLRHELAHVQRRDLWKSLALRALALPHWFNPWAWWSVSLFEEAAEWACDEVAVAAGLSPRDYSRLLVQVSSTTSGYPARPLGASAAKLATRIAFLVEPARVKESIMKHLAIGTLVGLLLLANLTNLRLVERSALAQLPAAPEKIPEIPTPAAQLSPIPELAAASDDATAILLACNAIDEESGEPVGGANVTITWEYYSPNDNFEEQQRLRGQLQKTTTDEQGRYSVTLPTWTHSRPHLHVRVEMTRAGYLQYWDSKLVKEIVDADRTKQVATFQLAKLTEAREIIGRVVDLAGVGVENVHLMKHYEKEPFVFPTDKQRRDIRDNEFNKTDAEGRFRCQVPARGYASIRFRAFHDFVELPYEVTAERDQGDIRVNYGTRFSGRVLASTGQPLANGYVSVQIPNINGAPNSDCQPDGSFITEAFGVGKHIISVGWAGPPGTPRSGATWIPPELYLPLEFELTGERQEIPNIEFRPIESVRVKAQVVSFPAETGDQWTDLVMRLPAVEIRGQYFGKPWKGGGLDLHDDGSGKSKPPLAPRGLIDVELWFGDLPQRVQLSQGAPLLFGSAMKLARLDADLTDIRIHRYNPSIVKLNLTPPHKHDDVTIVGAYDREPEMIAAGMHFKNSEAPMPKGVHGNEVRYLVLPDEPLQFTITAEGFQPRVEKMQLKEGETKSIDVKLIAVP